MELTWYLSWKSIDYKCEALFMDSNSMPLISVSIFMPILHFWFLYLCGKLWTQKEWCLQLCYFLILIRLLWGPWISKWILLTNFCKENTLDFHGDCIKSIDQLGEYLHITIFIFLNYKHRMTFHLFTFSFLPFNRILQLSECKLHTFLLNLFLSI